MILEIEKLLLDKDICSVRLVVNPEKMVVDESKRAFTYINLFDYNIDGIVINRHIPESLNDPFFNKWRAIQKKELIEIEKIFSPVPQFKVNLFDEQICGLEMLKKLGDAIYGDKNPAEIFYNQNPYKITKNGEESTISLYLPNTKKEDIEVSANNEECIVRVKDYERKIILPNSMIGCKLTKIKLVKDTLNIILSKNIESDKFINAPSKKT